jgi:hypothetical protein
VKPEPGVKVSPEVPLAASQNIKSFATVVVIAEEQELVVEELVSAKHVPSTAADASRLVVLSAVTVR